MYVFVLYEYSQTILKQKVYTCNNNNEAIQELLEHYKNKAQQSSNGTLQLILGTALSEHVKITLTEIGTHIYYKTTLFKYTLAANYITYNSFCLYFLLYPVTSTPYF